MTISSLITDFLEYLELERNASPLTIKNYDHYLKRFLEFTRLAKHSGDIHPNEINLNLVRKYKLYLSRKPLKPVTQNFFLIALRAFLRYLAHVDITTLPPQKVELGEQDTQPLKILEQTHIRALLQAPDITQKDGMRDRAILEMLFSTGLLVSELASLDRDTINQDRGEFRIIGKGGKERVVFISDSAAGWLRKYLMLRKDTFKPLFIRYQGKVDSANNGESMRLTTRSIERIVEKYASRLGLPIKVTPHTLRHSFAMDLLIKGLDIRSIQEMLGHSNISQTQIYTYITNSHLKDVHKAFHSENK